jgi:hypothetical protein
MEQTVKEELLQLLTNQEILCRTWVVSMDTGSQARDIIKLLHLKTWPESSHAMIAKRAMDFLTLTTYLSNHHDANHKMSTSAWTLYLRTP